MGWFSGKNSSSGGQGQPTPDEPFVADDQIVARVAQLMVMWNDAVGNDAMMRATARSISSAAGLNELDEAVMNPALLQRPWKMLAAVIHRAAQSGDNILVGRILGFISLWSTQIAPHLRPADWFDMLLDKVPPAIEADIASVAFSPLRQLPDNTIIFHNATGSVTAADLRIAAAQLLVGATAKGVSVDDTLLSAARSLLR
jgi:hypothetical protein